MVRGIPPTVLCHGVDRAVSGSVTCRRREDPSSVDQVVGSAIPPGSHEGGHRPQEHPSATPSLSSVTVPYSDHTTIALVTRKSVKMRGVRPVPRLGAVCSRSLCRVVVKRDEGLGR